MVAPDPLAVRAYHVALKRHRDAAIAEAEDLQRTVERIVKDLRLDGRASPSTGRSALHIAGMLLEKLVALETLRQDAEHLTVDPDAAP